MRMAWKLSLLGASLGAICLVWPANAQVRTARKAISDTYHGVAVVDDYRWLENAADPKVKEWTHAQNDHARAQLDKAPTRAALAYELGRLFDNVSADYSALKV